MQIIIFLLAGLDETSDGVSGGAQLSRRAKRTAIPSTADRHGPASQLSTKGRGKSTARAPLTCGSQSPEEENGTFILEGVCVCVCVCVCVSVSMYLCMCLLV